MSVGLFIEPLDVWLFRDGRPFDAGTDHRAQSLFPPLPTVIQGAVRTHYIERSGGVDAYLRGDLPRGVRELVGELGGPAPPALRVKGPFVARRRPAVEDVREGVVEVLVPLPADAVLVGDAYRSMELRPLPSGVLTDLDDVRFLWPPQGAGPREKGAGAVWITVDGLCDYLRVGQVPRRSVFPEPELFVRESRFGIRQDPETHSVVPEMLFQVEFVRPCPEVGLYVEAETLPEWPETGWLWLGGERRTGKYRRVPCPSWPGVIQSDKARFKLVFLTPTYFQQGWRPCDWSGLLGCDCRFLGAVLTGPLPAGGRDLHKGEDRPGRRFVPAGSVFYFEGQPPEQAQVVSEWGENIGFGQCMIGGF